MEFIAFDECIAEKIQIQIKEGKKLGIDFMVDKIPDCTYGGDNSTLWKNIEFFREDWERRSIIIGSMISDESASVIDCGCGNGKLKKYIGNRMYIGVDYCQRANVENIVIHDFNCGTFPNISADTIVVAGVLEYIREHDSLLKNVCEHALQEVIISYCVRELWMDIDARKKLGHQNFYDTKTLVSNFERKGYTLRDSNFYTLNHPIFKFVKR